MALAPPPGNDPREGGKDGWMAAAIPKLKWPGPSASNRANASRGFRAGNTR